MDMSDRIFAAIVIICFMAQFVLLSFEINDVSHKVEQIQKDIQEIKKGG